MKNMLIFSTIAAITFVSYYLMINRESEFNSEEVSDSKDPGARHLTDVFAKAKQHALHHASE